MVDRNQADKANQKFEQIRRRVRTAPQPAPAGAPAWLHEVEDLRDFFDATASIWDGIFGSDQPDPLYTAVAEQIGATETPVSILLLGCGTGLELPAILARVPNACITGIDVAPNMLAELKRKYSQQAAQIQLLEGSYLDLPLGQQRFDYVVAVLTVHHIPVVARLKLYQQICAALKPAGRYIEGDQSTDQEDEREILYWYNAYIAKLPGGSRAAWNYDVTLSPETQQQLLYTAGFGKVQLTWRNSAQDLVVLVATRHNGETRRSA